MRDKNLENNNYTEEFFKIEGLHPLAQHCEIQIARIDKDDFVQPHFDLSIYDKCYEGDVKPIKSKDPLMHIISAHVNKHSKLNMLDSFPFDLLIKDRDRNCYTPISHVYAYEASLYLDRLQEELGGVLFLTGSQGNNYGDSFFDIADHDLDVQFLMNVTNDEIKNRLLNFSNKYSKKHGNKSWDEKSREYVPRQFMHKSGDNITQCTVNWASDQFADSIGIRVNFPDLKFVQKNWRSVKIQTNASPKQRNRNPGVNPSRTLLEVGFPDIDGLPSIFYDLKIRKNLFRFSPQSDWYLLEVLNKPSYDEIKNYDPVLSAIMALRCVVKHKVGDDLKILNNIAPLKLKEVLNKDGEKKYRKNFVAPFIDFLNGHSIDKSLFESPGFYNVINNFFPYFTSTISFHLRRYLTKRGYNEDFEDRYTFYLIDQIWSHTKEQLKYRVEPYTLYSQIIDIIKSSISQDYPKIKENKLNENILVILEEIFDLKENLKF